MGDKIPRTYPHTCLMCGCAFESKLREHKYCGRLCRDKYWKGGGGLVRPRISGEIPLTERVCLKCKKGFLSWGMGNRMCTACRREPDKELGRW